MGSIKTEFVNSTQQALHVTVSNCRCRVNLTKIEKGSKHIMEADFNDTYHEYFVGPDRTGGFLTWSSDDCCDYKTITIIEVAGKFTAHKEPRFHYSSVVASEPVTASVAEKGPPIPSWKRWIRLGLF